jgi:hypothetical protein
VQQSLSLLSAKVSVCIAKDESNGREEVTLPRTIATDDHIVFWGERLDNRLIFVAVKATSVSA